MTDFLPLSKKFCFKRGYRLPSKLNTDEIIGAATEITPESINAPVARAKLRSINWLGYRVTRWPDGSVCAWSKPKGELTVKERLIAYAVARENLEDNFREAWFLPKTAKLI